MRVDYVDTETPIACFMDKNALNQFGWHFDYLHFEIMKSLPMPAKPNERFPQRFFIPHSIKCYIKDDLYRNYYDSIEFLQENLN